MGKEKRKVMQLPAYVSLFLWREPTLYTLHPLYHTTTTLLLVFLIRDYISLPLTNGAFALLGRESKSVSKVDK